MPRKNGWLRGGFVVAVAAMAALAAAPPGRAQDAPSGDAANGKKVYLADGCYECHGRVGEASLGPILAQTKLPFDAFKGQLRDPANNMPPYPDTILSDKNAADIFAYLHSLSGPRDLKDVPILND